MRQLFGFLLAVGISATLFGQTEEFSDESQLTMDYYNAIESNDSD